MENLLFYQYFCASVDVGRFLYLNKYASGLGSTNLSEGFFSLIFPTKRIFEPTILFLKKAARCHPFLAVVRCLFHNHLRLKRSSLLNVYLNCKFEISLLTSHLFFSLFILIFSWFLFTNLDMFLFQYINRQTREAVHLEPKRQIHFSRQT